MLTNTKTQLRLLAKSAAFITIPVVCALAPCALKAGVLQVSEQDAQKAIVSKVAPMYPPIARQMNLAGRVVVELSVNPEGSVDKANIVSGNPILGGAAANAAKRWKFQPFQENGKASEAVVRISFDFVRQ